MFPRNELLDMLTYQRPYDSASVDAFIARYIAPLPGATRDAFDNYIVHVGTSAVLWSCHTDTVHRTAGRQTLHMGADGVVRLSKRSIARGANCLGADDTVGVFIMRQMVLAGVPGVYVFHHGEEWGGIGSTALVDSAPDWLADIRYAIAFDRRGTGDVITHQGGRTASDEFALSLAHILNSAGTVVYAPSDRGIYTDTAEYCHVVPECTNLSVGYLNEHSTREQLDTVHVGRLLPLMLAFDEALLTCTRTPVDRYRDSGSRNGWTLVPDGPINTRSFDMSGAELIPECQWCLTTYDLDESDAVEQDAFCSDACELAYYVDLDDRRKRRATARDYFLTDEYADVQRHLRRIQ